MMAATVISTAVAYYVDGYSIYSARLPAYPDRSQAEPRTGGPGTPTDGVDQDVRRVAGAAGDGTPDAPSPRFGEVPE